LHQRPSDKATQIVNPAKDAAKKQDKLVSHVLRLLPSHLVPTFRESQSDNGTVDKVIAYVSPMTMATLLGLRYLHFGDFVDREPVSDAASSASLSEKATGTSAHSKYILQARVRRLPPPSDPTNTSPKAGPSPAPPSERVLHSSESAGKSRDVGSDKEGKREAKNDTSEIWIMFDTALYIPYSHLVITGALDAVLSGSLRDWDLIRCVYASVQGEAPRSPLTISSVTPTSERRSVPPAFTAPLYVLPFTPEINYAI